MADLNHLQYYLRREAALLDMARKARDPRIARIHLDCASAYADQAEAARRLQDKE